MEIMDRLLGLLPRIDTNIYNQIYPIFMLSDVKVMSKSMINLGM